MILELFSIVFIVGFVWLFWYLWRWDKKRRDMKSKKIEASQYSKNFGFSLLDVTNLESPCAYIRVSFIGLWSEGSTEFKNGRSVLAVEVAKDSLTVDAMFFKFHLKRK